MRVLYERCAAVDVGKDVIAVAARLPGDGPGGGASAHWCRGCWNNTGCWAGRAAPGSPTTPGWTG